MRLKVKTSSKENDSVEDFLYEWSRSSDNKCFLKNDLKDIDLYFREVQAAYEIVKTKNTAKIRKRRNKWNWPKREPVSDQDMFVIATVSFYQNYSSQRIILF